jgi:hypothetical protein
MIFQALSILEITSPTVLAITIHCHKKKRRHVADACLQRATVPSMDFVIHHTS